MNNFEIANFFYIDTKENQIQKTKVQMFQGVECVQIERLRTESYD